MKKLKTAWLSSEANKNGKKVAFLVVNDKSNDVGDDIEINSISELFSEYFKSNDNKKTFSSGIESLRSLDENKDGIINFLDSSWNKLKLWFDDGNAKTDPFEIEDISKFVDDIKIDSSEIVAKRPQWASGNNILRKVYAYKDDKVFQFMMLD